MRFDTMVPTLDPRDPYDQRQRRSPVREGGSLRRLEIPTTEDSTGTDKWIGRSFRWSMRKIGWNVGVEPLVFSCTGGRGVRY